MTIDDLWIISGRIDKLEKIKQNLYVTAYGNLINTSLQGNPQTLQPHIIASLTATKNVP